MNRRSFIGNGIMAALAGPAALSIGASEQGAQSGQHYISVTVDGKHWFTDAITDEELASAAYNPATGQTELIRSMEIPGCEYPNAQFASDGEIVGIYDGRHSGSLIGCVEIIVICIVIVAGIMIWQLVKLCQHVLPAKKQDDQ
jgi:hypothetical protein